MCVCVCEMRVECGTVTIASRTRLLLSIFLRCGRHFARCAMDVRVARCRPPLSSGHVIIIIFRVKNNFQSQLTTHIPFLYHFALYKFGISFRLLSVHSFVCSFCARCSCHCCHGHIVNAKEIKLKIQHILVSIEHTIRPCPSSQFRFFFSSCVRPFVPNLMS